MKAIRKIRSKNYQEILEVTCPIRFYFSNDTEFDGVELGPFPEDTSRYQIRLVYHLLDRLEAIMPKSDRWDVPPVFKKAFEKGAES